jgi:rhodanese-related sulfurtransferase
MADGPTLKRALREAGSIVLVGAILGSVYNVISPHGINLVRQEQPFARSTDTSPHSTRSDAARPLFINIDEALRIFQQGKGLFIDARHEDEYIEGHIRGAISLPLRTLETNPALIQGLGKDTLIVTYCSGERCALSIDLGERLASMGFTNVKVFFSGWQEWQKRNLPVEVGPKGNS